MAIPEGVLGREPSLGVVRVWGVVRVESSPPTTSTGMEIATVGPRHTLVAHIAGARHGDIGTLSRVDRLVVQGRIVGGDRSLSHVALL
jgi:hypothetical protein